MGVSFYAYSNIKHTPEIQEKYDAATDDTIDDLYDWLNENDYHKLFAYRGFHRSTRGLVNHKGREGERHLVNEWYHLGPIQHDWSTSYGWYGTWRRSLSKGVLGVKAEKIWKNPKYYKKAPFVELINFADNEGAIGPTACADLLLDFKEHRKTYVKYLGKKYDYEYERESFIRFYDDFTTGFEAAAVEGCIRLS